jgi:multiple antibiotic resistance protein
MEQHLQAIVTVLSLVNPMICGAMFARIEAGQTRAERLADATKAALAVLVILVVAALVGARLLQVFGVSLDAFSVAGGGVLSWIGFTMMRANSAPVEESSKEGADEKRSITPLILFAASPGTITGVITLAVAHEELRLPVTALVAVVVATVVMWIVMVLVARGEPLHLVAFCATRQRGSWG